MAFKASLQVLFGCNWTAASKLLTASEKGSSTEVSEILCSKPQLAAYTGFNNSFSPLHRAAAAGHVEVCRCIVEPIKQRVKVAEAAVASRRKRQAVLKKWQNLLSTVLNQRTSRSMTPLMLACESGHSAVAAYLLREGADPLACDWVHMRTCLHYAAMGGQVDCLRLLCSANTQVAGKEGPRALRDVVVQDIQVETSRFIDQRAFGGLTPLHFAVVTGNLEAVQALLRGGASIMVKTDGEAYIGDEYLVPGSTPLHIAVIIGNISIVHAILQAHMENMNVVGQGLDERGRRPWEGSSRTDIRSVRNTFRKLPFHLARERGLQQLMSLVDPRIPIDVALDAARDTEHGIGPKRLSTIVSLVLQQSLLHWLDDCQKELEQEASVRHGRRSSAQLLPAAASPAPAPGSQQRRSPPPVQAAAAASPGSAAAASSGRPPLPRSGSRRLSRDPASPGQLEPAAVTSEPAAEPSSLPLPPPPQQQQPPLPPEEGVEARDAGPPAAGSASPSTPNAATAAEAVSGDAFAEELVLASVALPSAALEDRSTPQSPFERLAPVPVFDPACPYITQSAPVSPATGVLGAGDRTPSAPIPLRLPHTAALPGSATAQVLQDTQQAGGSGRAGEERGGPPSDSLHGYMGMLSVKRPRTRSLDPPNISAHYPGAGGASRARSSGQALNRAGEDASARRQALHRQHSLPASLSTGNLRQAGSAAESMASGELTVALEEAPDRTVTVVSGRRSVQSGTPTIRGVLSSIRGRLRSSDSLPPPAALEEGKDKDLVGELDPPSPVKSEQSDGDMECGVCLDHAVEVAFRGCEHSLCLECARNLTKLDKKPPHCPFCRKMVVGFTRVSPHKHSWGQMRAGA